MLKEYLDKEQEKLLTSYFKELEKIARIQEDPDLTPAEKRVLYIRLKNLVSQEYVDLVGRDIVKEIDLHCMLLQTAIEKGEDVNGINVLKFLEVDSEKLSWVVQGLIPIDMIFIAAAAKTGKSDLMMHLLRCVLLGHNFLGLPTTKGKVLYFQLEESNHSIQTKLKLHGFNTPQMKKLLESGNIIFYRTLDLYNDFQYLIQQVEYHKPLLIIIDTVVSSMVNSGLSMNQAEFTTPFRKVQTEVCIKRKCAVILLHHLNTQNKMYGSAILPTIGGGNWIFTRDGEPHENKSKIEIKSRDCGHKNLILKRGITNEFIVDYQIVAENEDDDLKHYRDMIIKYLLRNTMAKKADLLVELSDLEEEQLNQILLDTINMQLIDFVHEEDDGDLEPVFFVADSALEMFDSSEFFQEYKRKLDLANEISTKLNTIPFAEFEDYIEKLKEEHGTLWHDIWSDIYHSLNRKQQLKLVLNKYPHKYHNMVFDNGDYAIATSFTLEHGKPIYTFDLYDSDDTFLKASVEEVYIFETYEEKIVEVDVEVVMEALPPSDMKEVDLGI